MSNTEHYFKYSNSPVPKVMYSVNSPTDGRRVENTAATTAALMVNMVRPLSLVAVGMIAEMLENNKEIPKIEQKLLNSMFSNSFEYQFKIFEGQLRCYYVAKDMGGTPPVVLFDAQQSERMWQAHVQTLNETFPGVHIERPEPTVLRYDIGQRVAFLRYIRQGQKHFDYHSPFRPWQEELDSIELKVLTCKEAHMVPGEWSDEPKYQGFIFEDDDGRQYLNQYPRASYGQTDDTNNWHVTMKDPDTNRYYVFEDATQTINRITRGMSQFKQATQKFDIEPEHKKNMLNYSTALAEHREDLVAFIEKQLNCKIKLEPMRWTNEIGEVEIVKDVLLTSLIWPGEDLQEALL